MATDGPAGMQGAAAVDAVFAEVIAAEQAAEVAVRACRDEAAQRVATARREAAALDERRRQRYQAWCARQAVAQAAALAALADEARAAAQPVALDAAARQRLERAVERLADELCGAPGDSG